MPNNPLQDEISSQIYHLRDPPAPWWAWKDWTFEHWTAANKIEINITPYYALKQPIIPELTLSVLKYFSLIDLFWSASARAISLLRFTILMAKQFSFKSWLTRQLFIFFTPTTNINNKYYSIIIIIILNVYDPGLLTCVSVFRWFVNG